MITERMLTTVYFALGIAMGVVSTRLDMIISILIGIGVYLVSFFIVRTLPSGGKKMSWYVMNTLLTFILVWLVTWIFVFNL